MRCRSIGLGWGELALAFASIAFLLLVDFFDSRRKIEKLVFARPRPIRWAAYYALLLAIVLFGVYNHTAFIYFQF